ncbi:isocitrate dehydrogenase (NAD(+)) idh1 [Cymbomonas tetramitiformis]|uniref:Isocitrate dehydrogenase (NAD(+)) idh1 n=1 Tax=Cymbomonas tetramitiformis TaxID=36881 RepID=A0AAE0GWS2_9CHLO|nr:isocitrate dehydrogenase (NAD(+)) idh1 [Cymbomonas tetramitiformis]|eukprot:gene24710-30081_t
MGNPISARFQSSAAATKIVAPPMVYISGEEMTKYCMEQIMDKWISPRVDTTKWEYYDLSCVSRDTTEDQCLRDAVAAGARVGAIFKEPTVTPTEVQKAKLGLKKAWGSPNGAMRRGWNGITISRDTIHIEGIDLGFKRPVLFERQAVGGEYGAGYKMVGKGKLTTMFYPEDGSEPVTVDERTLTNENSAAVTYDNPLDNVPDLAHHFFSRCLEADVVPYVVTKKTVFKWQEGFWVAMKEVFDAHYKQKYIDAGLLPKGELQHLISDAATMQIIKWTDGGFGMAAHNYDGDMLTDEVSQVHRSPGFISSSLVGKAADGSMIKEFEASHGTVADLWDAHLRGEETSLNPLGLVEALIGAMQHAASLEGGPEAEKIIAFTNNLRKVMHQLMVEGKGTRDLCGPAGLTTEQFIEAVAERI